MWFHRPDYRRDASRLGWAVPRRGARNLEPNLLRTRPGARPGRAVAGAALEPRSFRSKASRAEVSCSMSSTICHLPEGDLKIAHPFKGGTVDEGPSVPKGRLNEFAGFSRPFGTYAKTNSDPALNCRAILKSPFGRCEASAQNFQRPERSQTLRQETELCDAACYQALRDSRQTGHCQRRAAG